MHRGMHRGMRIPDTNAPRNARRFTLDDPVVEVELGDAREAGAVPESRVAATAAAPRGAGSTLGGKRCVG